MSETLQKDKLYPLAPGERVPGESDTRNVRARATGEFRAPRRGEWYLSGATIEAYRAPSDLTTSFHIARLVRGRLVWVADD